MSRKYFDVQIAAVIVVRYFVGLWVVFAHQSLFFAAQRASQITFADVDECVVLQNGFALQFDERAETVAQVLDVVLRVLRVEVNLEVATSNR